MDSLSKRQEWLLQKFYDGSCCFAGRWLAQMLLRRNRAAQNFFDRLRETSEATQIWSTIEQRTDLDLWESISTRIDET